jgi:erythromycin esterase
MLRSSYSARSSALSFMALALLTACGSAASSADPPAPPPTMARAPSGADADATAAPHDTPPLPALPRGVTALSVPPLATELAPLDELAATAQVFGIGESVHTSGGFVDTKVAIVEHLVTAQGYRVIAFESPRASVAAKMAPYVASCAGTPDEAMKALFAVWWTPSTRDLMSWLCTYNQTHTADPVSVVGVDIQQAESDATTLSGAVSKTLYAGLSSCKLSNSTDAYAKADYDTCLAGLDAIDAAIDPGAFDVVLAAKSFRAWQTEVYDLDKDPKGSFEARDVGMAAMFEAMRARSFATKKTILWAHNYHLSEAHTEVAVSVFPARAITLGSILRKDLGASYRAVGLVGWDVEINFPPTPVGKVGDADPDAYEVKLHALGRPSMFVRVDETVGDLDGATLRPLGTPSEETVAPAHQFDALLFLDVSKPMTHLGW